MHLQGYLPLWIPLDIFNNFRNNMFKPAPFRLKVEVAFGADKPAVFFCPLKIVSVMDNYF